MRDRLAACLVEAVALDQLNSVVRQRSKRGQRLVEFVHHAGRQLTEHRQLAGMHQLILRSAQFGGAFFDLQLERIVRRLQRLPAGQPLAQRAAALHQQQPEQQQDRRRQTGTGSCAGRRQPRRRLGIELQKPPAPVVYRTLADQPGTAVGADPGRLLGKTLAQAPIERPQIGVAIAPRLHRLGARRGRQLGERMKFPVGPRGEDHHVVFVEQQHLAGQFAPGFFARLEIDLDRRDAVRRTLRRQCIRQVIAGATAGHADAVEPSPPVGQRVAEIGPIREVMAERRTRLAGVGCGHCDARSVQHIKALRAGDRIERFQIAIDRFAQCRVGGFVEQAQDLGRGLEQRRQIAEACQFGVEPRRFDLQPLQRSAVQGLQSDAKRDTMGHPGDRSNHQQADDGDAGAAPQPAAQLSSLRFGGSRIHAACLQHGQHRARPNRQAAPLTVSQRG